MYKSIFVLFFSIVSFFIQAQVPQGLSYQAVAFNSSGNPVVNSNVGVRISILDNSTSGTTVYSETHSKTTNSQGLFNLNIGQGTPNVGTFSLINWAQNTKFLKVEIDPNGGSNYTSIGTNQLMSVPYALFSEKSNSTNTISNASKTNPIIVVYTNTHAYAFYQHNGATGNWSSQSLSGSILGAIASDDNIVIYTTTNAYSFHQHNGGTGNWNSQSLSGNVIGAVASNSNIVVYTNSTAYSFHQHNGATGNWNSQSLSGSPINAVGSEKNIVIYTNNNAYSFSQYDGGSGNWHVQSLSGTPQGAVTK